MKPLLGFFPAKLRAAGAAVLAVTIGADQSVAKFNGAKFSADVAHGGFIDAILRGFNRLFRHDK
jgi:hypothetical protein